MVLRWALARPRPARRDRQRWARRAFWAAARRHSGGSGRKYRGSGEQLHLEVSKACRSAGRAPCSLVPRRVNRLSQVGRKPCPRPCWQGCRRTAPPVMAVEAGQAGASLRRPCMKLLVIEDNAAMQTTLQRSPFERRRSFGGRLSTTAPKVAQPLALASVPDVVLLDLSMPGLDGLDVLSQARAEGLTTPVIIITARGTLGDKHPGPEHRRRRLPAQALRPGRAGGPHPRAGAPPGPGERGLPGRARRPASAACAWTRKAAPSTTRASPWTCRRARSRCCARCSCGPARPWPRSRLFEIVFADAADAQPDAIEVVAYRLRKRLAPPGAKLVTLRGLGYLLQSND